MRIKRSDEKAVAGASSMNKIDLKKLNVIFIMGCIAFILTLAFNVNAQENYSYNGNVTNSNSIEKNKEALMRWWNNFSDCSAKKILDSARTEKMFEIVLAGEFPVTYHMYGSTADGGLVRFKLQIRVINGSCDYKFYDLYHRSVVGVKHKDGGALMEEKPMKGSMIFGRSWKSYQEQGSAFIHNSESEIIRVVK
ncbi:MAG: hypothetical protein WAU36_04255 [Cyclobacteriaceae bacterium]